MLGIFLDIETNGLSPFRHRILEIAFKIVNVYTGEQLDSFESILFQPLEVWEKSNPESLKINGFTWEKLVTGKIESEVEREINKIFEKHKINQRNAVFICQNPSFDRMFFAQLFDPEQQVAKQWPYHWLDLASMYWAFRMQAQHYTPDHLPSTIPLSKDIIAAEHQIPREKMPHQAMNGVDHLLLCYKAVVGFPLQK